MSKYKTQRHKLVFFVNGQKVEDCDVDPEWTLLYYLRRKLRLCGTKLGCGEGGCGACTVMVSKYDRENNIETHIPVNACLAPLCSMHGLAVTTVEGIGSTKSSLHPVQERIAKAHGSQCGFCTPGIVMSMYTLLRQNPKPKMSDLEEAFIGNLCRCTGYRPIIEGYKTFTEEWELARNSKFENGSGVCGMGDRCCKLQKDSREPSAETNQTLFNPSSFTPYHPSQEPIFPPELKLTNQYDTSYLIFKGPIVTWYRPIKLPELLDLKSKLPEAKIVVGNTEIGVETKFKNMVYPILIQASSIDQLTKIFETVDGVNIGASASLASIGQFLEKQIQKQVENKTRIFKAFVGMLRLFAGKQICSVGSLGGNIITGSPISDLVPLLMACKAKLELQSKLRGSRTVILDDNFITGYRKCAIEPDEVLVAIVIPFSEKNQYFEAFKQARRREDDIAIVNLAVSVHVEENSDLITDIKFGIGGMSFKIVEAPKTQAKLKGVAWRKDILDIAYPLLLEDLPLEPGAPGGMVPYRQSLVLSLFLKAFLTISQKLQTSINLIDGWEVSGATNFQNKPYTSSQYFKVVPGTQIKEDSVQRPMVHTSAFKQATGEAVYCDDMPRYENELYLAFVLSSKAHANISIDPSEALKIKGVEGFVSADDLNEENNKMGYIIPNEEQVFYSKKVTSEGQIIGAVVAIDQPTAQKAVKLVKVYYDTLKSIITIEDAIKQKSFFDSEQCLEFDYGEVEKVMQRAPHVIQGVCKTGNQKIFYLETHSVLAVPKGEDGAMEIFCATQGPAEIAKKASEMLNVHQNKITVNVKRLGGGFGGKEWKSVVVALPVIFAAHKFQRPVRCMLDRDEDMLIVGGRPSYHFEYKVGVKDNGHILGVEFDVFTNGGYSLELTAVSLWKTLTHLDNAFNVHAYKAKGKVCKTNIPSNTAMRGFGGPEAIFASLCIIEKIAEYLKRDMDEVIEVNLYKEGEYTFYGQKLVDCNVRKCWEECLESSRLLERRTDIEKFNRENRYKKRGISIIPTKFGIGLDTETSWFTQAAALVNVYTDGSVLLHHGGVEMGQGLYTKLIQIATRVLEVPAEKIYTETTATNVVPNCNPTVASLGSDLFGPAVIDACTKIKDRLRPYKESNPNGTWEQWVQRAFFDKVSLSATGFYGYKHDGYDPKTKTGNIFNYFVCGVGCSEVEIDTLTGDHQVLRTDIVMDLGESLNPAIDIGQIEGAFMQGYGLFVMEESVFSPEGTMYTKGPGTYKIPGFGDIPGVFNVSLLQGTSNPRAVYSSKAVGEPPLGLACSVFFAIKDAIKAARKENGVFTSFGLDAPATSEKIRMACVDSITQKVSQFKEGSFLPWNVVT